MSDLAIVLKAADFSARKHQTHRRKGQAAEPYVNHPIEVAHLLAEATGDADPALVAAGLLHDVIEDADVSRAELAEIFGTDIADLVAAVTDDKSLPKAERKQRQVTGAPHKPPRARLLKLADKISNLHSLAQSPPADWSDERIRAYADWADAVAAACLGLNDELDARYHEARQALLAGLEAR